MNDLIRRARICLPLIAIGALLGGPSVAGASIQTLGLRGWSVQSSASAGNDGAAVSRPHFAPKGWLKVAEDDGGAPGTEVEALLQNGRCPNVFFSTNMKRCFGYMSTLGRVTIPLFAKPWWFRTTFSAARSAHAALIVNGVVGEADLWLNGHRVAGRTTLQGAYTQYTFDVSGRLRRGTNALAFRLHPNDPTKMFTLDNVDWTQIPPDNNTGIQLPVQLHTSSALSISDVHVVEHNSRRVTTSALTLRARVTNSSHRAQRGLIEAQLTPPSGSRIRVAHPVTIPAGATQTISLTPSSFHRLLIHHPQVWWPYQMGAQPLYGLRMAIGQTGARVDSASETFGIRTITTRLVGRSPLAPHGSRQFLVNGRPVMFRGGGWSENLFLHYSAADTANQIAIIKNLGLNGIRTEGKEMPADFYDQMDRAGILIDAGFQCCDAWQLPDDGKGVTARDYQVLANSALAIGRRLRNHPSIINFSWSDNNPTPRQAAVSIAAFRRADFQEPLIASAEYKTARGLEWSGEKEGPYDWVPPSYWYDTSHYAKSDSSRTNAGGAWAFDSEAGEGATIPTLDSIHRFLSPFEQTQLWKAPNFNQYHLNYEPNLPGPNNGGYSFGTLHDLDQAMKARYGGWSSLSQFVQEAQLQNYETQRAEFEAYVDHSRRAKAPSTGLVYWQLNKGWPTLLWDLYNNDYDQAGSYFGAQEANKSLHAIYAYGSGTVSVANLTGAAVGGLSVQSRVYSVAGKLLDDRIANGVALGAQGVRENILRPAVPAATKPPHPAQDYFVELLLRRGGQVIDRNVYWLSTQRDVVNWSKTIGQPQAKMRSFANLSGLRALAPAHLAVTAHTTQAGSDDVTQVTIANRSSTPAPAFFVRTDLRRGSAAGVRAGGDDEVLPALWSDNDTTLWPGESETLQVRYSATGLRGASPVVTVSGFNVAPLTLSGQ
ncbi:MAG: glycosyl hydrolase 2 galactose-binding domain-containing protein [Solirubrobacteraceae bacterium]